MPAAKVRSDYDQLKKLQKYFSEEADYHAQQNQELRARMDTLQGGDWIGEGATKFYAEMNDQVMPSLTRLQKAWAEAARVTGQISAIMKAAEDAASGVFKVVGQET
ncbi:MAG: WXG100 family type VII secretion target [Chloroflexi bacterium]|nr:WXG100 family type VII secretion target [Chloroflexota bacterium]